MQTAVRWLQAPKEEFDKGGKEFEPTFQSFRFIDRTGKKKAS